MKSIAVAKVLHNEEQSMKLCVWGVSLDGWVGWGGVGEGRGGGFGIGRHENVLAYFNLKKRSTDGDGPKRKSCFTADNF